MFELPGRMDDFENQFVHCPRRLEKNKQKKVSVDSLFYVEDYSALIAPVGQAPTHVPQSIHSAAVISKTPPASWMQPVGHSPAQAPQPIHSGPIL